MSGPYIYESPDGGKTVTRRKFGSTVKEIIQTADEVVEELFSNEPAMTTLSEAQIDTTFHSIRESLKNVHLRANWTQDYTMSKHVSKAETLLEQLEKDIRIASDSAKLALSQSKHEFDDEFGDIKALQEELKS